MNLDKLFSLLKEIRAAFVELAGIETIVRTVDFPLQMSTSFAITSGPEVLRAWEIKIRDLFSLPERERFVLTSVPGRELVAKYLFDTKSDVALVFEHVYPLCLDLEWGEILKQIEQKEATEISRKLLLNCLQGEQLQAFQDMEAFIVFAENEKFLLSSKHELVSLDEQDHAEYSFCIHPESWIPIYDTMLALKLLLESNLPLFYAIANKKKASFQQQISTAIVVGQIKFRQEKRAMQTSA